MNILLILLAIIGGGVVAYWGISTVIGTTADKRKLGEAWIIKNLKLAGIDSNDVPEELISKLSNSAYLFSVATEPDYGKFHMTTFKQDLDYKSQLLIRHLSGAILNEDEKSILGL